MKIVIAGGSGLIGRHLSQALLQLGHTVTGLTRRAVTTRSANDQSFTSVHWDGTTLGDWTNSLEDTDVIVNLSGQSLSSGRWTEPRKQMLLASRLNSTRVLVEAIRGLRKRPGVFINASAVGYYGPVESGDVTEDHPPGADFLALLCAQWENEAMAAATLGLRTAVLRTGIVLDPSGGALQRMVLPFRFFVGGALGNGRQWLPWIHREDHVRATVFAIERPEVSGPLNLVAPDVVTMSEFSETLGRVLHRPSFMKVPAFALRALLGDMASVVLTGQRAVPRKLLHSGFSFLHPALSGALTNLLQDPSSAH